MEWDREIESVRALQDLIRRVEYKAGWRFAIEYEAVTRPRLTISIQVTDSVSGWPLEVRHIRPAPDFPLDERTLRAWLFEQILLIERHEAMEFFKVDGTAPYFPDHTPGGNPYALVDAAD